MNTKKPLKTIELAFIGIFVALITICSWITIPATVPFTLQTFAVFLTIALLGLKRGTIAVTVYILLGAIGVPVFSNFTGGIGSLLGTTGGYIVGFLLSAVISGVIMEKFGKKLPVMILAMLLGLLACYALGTAWFMVVYTKSKGAVSLLTTLGWCVFPFILPDCVKIALAILLSKRLSSHLPF